MGLETEIKAILQNAGTGLKVYRPAAPDVVAATTIFTITGGLVLVTSLVGIVTVIRVGGAGATQALTFSVGPTALHTPALAVTGNATVGTMFTITGDPGDALVVGVGTGVLNTAPPIQGGLQGSALTGIQQFGMIMGVGLIQVAHSAIGVAPIGQTRYILTYIPLDMGAVVT